MSDILKQKEVKTRKRHICFGCGLMYPIGSKMILLSIADGGTVWDSYMCETCTEYSHRHIRYDDEFGFGELRDGDKGEWYKIKKELEKSDKPAIKDFNKTDATEQYIRLIQEESRH